MANTPPTDRSFYTSHPNHRLDTSAPHTPAHSNEAETVSTSTLAYKRAVALLQPGQPGYDASFPTFAEPESEPDDGAVQRTEKKGKGKAAATDNQPETTTTFQSTIGGETPAVPAVKSHERQGNFGHGRAVPWLSDEEDYIKGLIIICREEGYTWNELAAASNDYFRDKPIQQANGEVIQRGNRTGQGVRQHSGFEDEVIKNWWYRLDVEWKHIRGARRGDGLGGFSR
ncbi:hypothetical protein LTR08_003729 [Meristemomyces frigidus]|nr:hypothetical protein LTR08_003729 [Meristemomyces frigidus]